MRKDIEYLSVAAVKRLAATARIVGAFAGDSDIMGVAFAKAGI